jgi:hypothetical protein
MIKYVYCRHDAYPSHLGRLLLNVYNTKEKAEALISLGDMSSVDSVLEKCDRYDHAPDSPPNVVRSIGEMSDGGISKYVDYTYIFRDGKWQVSRWDYAEYFELTQKMIDEDQNEKRKLR